MKNLFVKWDSNWADEMDVSGWRIFSKEDWGKYKKAAEKLFKEEGYYSVGIGTNEDIEYHSLEDLMGDFTVKSISDVEEVVIEKFLGGCGDNGPFPDFDYDDEDED